MTTDLCWCGSGKAYADCHSEIDAKIELYRKAGHEVPDREMIKTPEQIAGIREACKINTAVLDEVEKNIKTGMTTEEINTIVHEYTVSHGAIPAPLNFCGFPKSVCTSINDQVCHGIPSAQDVLKSGDIVNVDVSTIYNGYYADASRMFMIGKVDKKKQDLVAITKECLRRGLEAALRGALSAISAQPCPVLLISMVILSSLNSAVMVWVSISMRNLSSAMWANARQECCWYRA